MVRNLSKADMLCTDADPRAPQHTHAGTNTRITAAEPLVSILHGRTKGISQIQLTAFLL